MDAAASVKDGVLRLEGNHNEGDQRLCATPEAVLGLTEFPTRFRVRAEVGGEADQVGAWHAGVSVGNVRVLFHPTYPGGGFPPSGWTTTSSSSTTRRCRSPPPPGC